MCECSDVTLLSYVIALVPFALLATGSCILSCWTGSEQRRLRREIADLYDTIRVSPSREPSNYTLLSVPLTSNSPPATPNPSAPYGTFPAPI
jgi:hypothetical protein